MDFLTLQEKRREVESCDGYFFIEAMNSSMGMAGSVVSFVVSPDARARLLRLHAHHLNKIDDHFRSLRVKYALKELWPAINLSVVSAFVFMGANIVSPILPQFALTFGIPIALTGWAISSYALARVVADIPGGTLSGRYGCKKIMISGLVISALSSTAAGLAPNYIVLILARAAAGTGSAFYVVSAVSLLARFSQGGNRGKIMGMYSSTVFTGMAAGPMLGGFIAAFYGIQAPFFVYALMTAVGVVFTVPLPDLDTKDNARKGGPSLGDLKAILSNHSFIRVSFAVLALFFLRSSVRSTLIPLYASINLGLGEDHIGILMTVAMVTTALSSYPSGWLSDRVGRKLPIMLCVFSSAFIIVLVPFQSGMQSLAILMAVYGLATGFQGSISAWPADLSPYEKVGTAIGAYRFIADLGFFLGPITVTYINDLFNPELITVQSFIVPSIIAIIAGIGLTKAEDPSREAIGNSL